MKEALIQKLSLRAASAIGFRLFRNNVGKAWIGKSIPIKDHTWIFCNGKKISLDKGDVIIKNARRFHAGLHEGSSDLIGWKSLEITPEMVGKKVAVFVSDECKSKSGKVNPKQQNWLDVINGSGGLGFVSRDESDPEKAWLDYLSRMRN